MVIELAPDFLIGSYPPLITPFLNGSVDVDTYATLVDFQYDGGSQGIVVNGTTGEPSLLSVEERNLLADTAIAAAAGRFPVIVATGSQSLAETMLALGAAGVVNADSNLAPRAVAELCTAVRNGNLLDARRRHFQLLELNRAVFWDTNPIPMKYLMKHLGLLKTNEHRLPMAPATRELEHRLDQLAEAVGLGSQLQ